MNLLPRILEGRYYFWILGGMLMISHTLLSIQAWQGSKLSLGIIIALWVLWTILALRSQATSRRTLNQTDEVLEGWRETNELVRDYGSLLREAAYELSLWDHEKADDILSRTTTISLMRAQNMKRRMPSERPNRSP